MGLILLPGEVPTGATGPPGWTIRALPLPGDAQGRYVVHATQPSPGLAPGATLAIQFTTRAALATNRAREIRFSSTCVVGSDVVKQSTGPTRRCVCQTLTAVIEPNTVAIVSDSRRGMRLIARVRWAMHCSAGSGVCGGHLTLRPSRHSRDRGVRVVAPKHSLIECDGRCERTTSGKARFTLVAGPAFGRGVRGRRVGVIGLTMFRFCRIRDPHPPLTFRIVFTENGEIDRGRSDLNANTRNDGDDR
jgi:hypothetical protein